MRSFEWFRRIFPFFHAKSWEKTVKRSIQDSLRFWIPDTGFQSLSVELGFWIPIVSWILDSLNCSPDSKAQDCWFHKQNILGFRIQSGFHYMERLIIVFYSASLTVKLFKQNFSVLKRVIHFSFLLFSSSATPTFRSLNFLTTWVCWWKSRKMKANQHQTSMRYSRNFLC